jgi:hypothetical protein
MGAGSASAPSEQACAESESAPVSAPAPAGEEGGGWLEQGINLVENAIGVDIDGNGRIGDIKARRNEVADAAAGCSAAQPSAPSPRGEVAGAVVSEQGGASERPSASPLTFPPAPSPATRLKRGVSLSDASLRASLKMGERGLRQRCGGAFKVPPAEMVEPQRTERILSGRVFSCSNGTSADAFHRRAGSLLFRVSGANGVTSCYRLIVIGINMSIGALAGLKPLLTPGSSGAAAQCLTVAVMQLGLAAFCLCCAPDADRIFSMLAGTQFLVEGLGTLSLFVAAVLPLQVLEPRLRLHMLAFGFSLAAVFVPILQLLEQRIVTPCAKACRAKGCNPVAICGAMIVLAAALPGAISRALKTLTGGSSADTSAQGSSGDEDAGSASGADADAEVGADADADAVEEPQDAPPPTPPQGISVSSALLDASRQLAILGGRNVAAGKLELNKKVEVVSEPPEEQAPPRAQRRGNVSTTARPRVLAAKKGDGGGGGGGTAGAAYTV